jgi:Na+-transporting NADH:ubiquinone oxidoreductase subunit B
VTSATKPACWISLPEISAKYLPEPTACGAFSIPWTLCSGALLYAACFMVTDPISAPKNKNAQWIYGAFIGVMIVFLRWKAVFAGAVAFAILLGNTLAPTLEMIFKARKLKADAKKGAKA